MHYEGATAEQEAGEQDLALPGAMASRVCCIPQQQRMRALALTCAPGHLVPSGDATQVHGTERLAEQERCDQHLTLPAVVVGHHTACRPSLTPPACPDALSGPSSENDRLCPPERPEARDHARRQLGLGSQPAATVLETLHHSAPEPARPAPPRPSPARPPSPSRPTLCVARGEAAGPPSG